MFTLRVRRRHRGVAAGRRRGVRQLADPRPAGPVRVVRRLGTASGLADDLAKGTSTGSGRCRWPARGAGRPDPLRPGPLGADPDADARCRLSRIGFRVQTGLGPARRGSVWPGVRVRLVVGDGRRSAWWSAPPKRSRRPCTSWCSRSASPARCSSPPRPCPAGCSRSPPPAGDRGRQRGPRPDPRPRRPPGRADRRRAGRPGPAWAAAITAVCVPLAVRAYRRTVS